jgi:hypothetical protein
MDEGADLTAAMSEPRTVFRIVFDFMLREALRSPSDGSYGSSLDGLVQLIAGVAGKRMVPGRVYSSWGFEDVSSLRFTLLAILAANFPEEGDDGVLLTVTELLSDGGPLSQQLASQSFGYEFDALLNIIGEQPDEVFGRTVHAFSKDLDPRERHVRLRELLQSIREAVRTKQQARLVAAPDDPAKIETVRKRLSQALLKNGPDVHVFQGFKIVRTGPAEPVQNLRFGVIDRGAFTTPSMSPISLDDYARIIAETSQQLLARPIWTDLFARTREVIEVEIREGIRQFWRIVIARAEAIGEEPTILVPYDKLGEGVALAGYGLPHGDLDEFKLTRTPNLSGGGGTAYLGTIEGVNVFSAAMRPGTTLMFSGNALRRIEYGIVAGDDHVGDFSFEDAKNPAESWVQLRFAQSVVWDESRTVEFTFDPEALPE